MNKPAELLKPLVVVLGAMLFALACKHNPLVPDDLDITPPDEGNILCDDDTVYFKNQVLPLMVSSCAKPGQCHNPDALEQGQNFTTYETIIEDGDIEAGNINHGKIHDVITEPDPADRMPPLPDSALTQAQIDIITTWINQGAKNNYCTGPSVCNTSNVSYAAHIKPLIENKCLGCHNSEWAPNASDIQMGTYSLDTALALNGKLYGVLTRAPGYQPMPKYQGKLTDCEIATVKAWIDAGVPNN